MPDCLHNAPRPQSINRQIFQKLDKYTRHSLYESKKLMSQSFCTTRGNSLQIERKRGIFVFTPAKGRQEATINRKSSPIVPQTPAARS